MRSCWVWFVSAVFLFCSAVAVHAAVYFSDVPSVYPYQSAIATLTASGVLHGYSDHQFRPDRTVNRAEFLHALLAAHPLPDARSSCTTRRLFPDVPTSAWFAKDVCIAHESGLVHGDASGQFRPSDRISFAEAATLISRAWALPTSGTGSWYEPSVRALAKRSAIPPTTETVHSLVTRGELADMLWVLQGGAGSGSISVDALLRRQCTPFDDPAPPGVDMEEVRHAWFQWVNDVRAQQGLSAYLQEQHLNQTALLWSQQAAAKGSISHQRPGQTAYYDYARMEQWFADQELSFRLVGQSAFAENIGWGTYSCTTGDCTQTLIHAVRTTFDFFVAERNKASQAHWKSLVNPSYALMGIGIATSSGKYFLTVHYATEMTSHPQALCP